MYVWPWLLNSPGKINFFPGLGGDGKSTFFYFWGFVQQNSGGHGGMSSGSLIGPS